MSAKFFMYIVARYGKLLLAGLLCIWVVACAKSPSQWREEVKLSSGETIVIWRETHYVSGGGEWATNPDMSRPGVRHLKFVFPSNSSQQVEWRSQPEPGGLYPESPLVFDIENGVPIVIVIASTSRDCTEYRRYLHLSTGWQRQALSQRDWNRGTNLLIASSNEYLITLEQKQKMNKAGAYPKWRKVIDPSGNSCPYSLPPATTKYSNQIISSKDRTIGLASNVREAGQ